MNVDEHQRQHGDNLPLKVKNEGNIKYYKHYVMFELFFAKHYYIAKC